MTYTCDLWNLTWNLPAYKCYFLLVSASFARLKKEEVLIACLFSWQGQFGVCENVVPKDEVSKLQKIIIILSNLIHDIVFCLAFFSSWIMQPSFMVATDVQTELNLPQWLTMNVSVKAIYYSFCRSQHDFFFKSSHSGMWKCHLKCT